LAPEFIKPQDGAEKQDCELNAAKRWLQRDIINKLQNKCTILGDDLFSHEPFCKQLLSSNLNFIFTCKEDSHKTLYEYIDAFSAQKQVKTIEIKTWNGNQYIYDTYRYVNFIPIKDDPGALLVNWFEIVSKKADGTIIYKNTFITNHIINGENILDLCLAGRARWKVENENNNTLKTKGYNLEHNFGHGEKNLSMVLATLNILAFLFHSVFELYDCIYQAIRKKIGARKTFFQTVRTITRFFLFSSWENLLDFIIEKLEIQVVLDTG
jgi:hypothetical protein